MAETAPRISPADVEHVARLARLELSAAAAGAAATTGSGRRAFTRVSCSSGISSRKREGSATP